MSKNQLEARAKQMRALCNQLAPSEDDAMSLRDRAMFMLLATTDCTLGEVLNIRCKDMRKLYNGSYVISPIRSSQTGKARSVPLSAQTHSAILDWLEFRPISGPYIFTSLIEAMEGSWFYSDTPITYGAAQSRITVHNAQVDFEEDSF